jgi:hypothetical protein
MRGQRPAMAAREWGSSAEKIRQPCAKCRGMASPCSSTGNLTTCVQSLGVGGPCSSPTGEASRMWSAVCSHTSTAGRHPGAKMMPGGGIPRSRARIAAWSASPQRGRQAGEAFTNIDAGLVRWALPSPSPRSRPRSSWEHTVYRPTQATLGLLARDGSTCGSIRYTPWHARPRQSPRRAAGAGGWRQGDIYG